MVVVFHVFSECSESWIVVLLALLMLLFYFGDVNLNAFKDTDII